MFALIAEYVAGIEELETKANECVEFAEAFKYATMAKNLKKEGNDEIDRMFETMPKPVLIPVEQDLIRRRFEITSVEVTSMDLSAITVEATLKIVGEDNTQSVHVQLCGLDESGVEIHPNLYLVGTITPINDQQVIVSGTIKNPENFTGLVKFKVAKKIPLNK
jgi:hypothetical protein